MFKQKKKKLSDVTLETSTHRKGNLLYLKKNSNPSLIEICSLIVFQEGIPVARLGPTDDPIPSVEKEIKKYF